MNYTIFCILNLYFGSKILPQLFEIPFYGVCSKCTTDSLLFIFLLGVCSAEISNKQIKNYDEKIND
ncbi:hypothetical protein SAMN05880574_11749 [Chryseobacterium sp. RU37D]|nr:hypothetical protein SAMN05880574_11749 [Chryseobacterium sp. RU37D]